MSIKDGTTVVCDQCGRVIAHLATPPAEDWSRLHNLCSSCFAARAATAV